MPSPNPYPPPGGSRVESVSPTTDPSPDELLEARRKLTEGVAYVYVPTRPNRQPAVSGPRQVEFELREFPDGSGGILIFTELDLLVAQLGEFQPWEKVAVLDLFIQVSGAKIPIMVNPVVDPGQERWTAASLAAWRDER